MKSASKICFPLRLCLLLLAFTSKEACARSLSSQSISFAPKSHQQIQDVSSATLPMNQYSKSLEQQTPHTSSPALKYAKSLRAGAMFTSDNLQGVLAFIIFDVLLRKVFVARNIAFPSMLGGCMLLFVVLVVGEILKTGFGDTIFAYLTPGSGLLAKWLPIFFVPGLAMLPLAPSVGAPIEVVKVLAVIVIGWFFSLFSTAFAVIGLQNLKGGLSPVPLSTVKAQAAPATKPPPAFPDEVYHPVAKGAVIFGILATALKKMDHSLAVPVQTLFMACTTIASYIFGTRLDKKITALIHPLVTSTVATLLVTNLSGKMTGQSFEEVLRTYKAGSLSVMKGGAGDFLLFLLGPSVISMCIAMYSRKQLMKDNLLVLLWSTLVSSGGGLFFTAAFVRLLKITSSILRVSVLPRNVTTALAMAISAIMEGDLGITASVVVMTGIFGATFGSRVLSSVGIMDPVARGLAVGSSSQGLGVASMLNEVDAFPFAAIALVLTAVCSTTLASIKPVRESILNLALGK